MNILPEQDLIAHFSVIMDFPLHGFPPYAAFCTTSRVFVLNELPQVALHSVSNHELHSQSTKIKHYFIAH